MFKWIKNLFVTAEDVAIPKQKLSNVTAQPFVLKQEDIAPPREPKVEAKVEQAKPVAKTKKQAKKPATKTTTKKPVAATKPGRKKKGLTKTDLNKMNKNDLEAFAKKTYKVDIDKRKKKETLVDEVLALSKKA